MKDKFKFFLSFLLIFLFIICFVKQVDDLSKTIPNTPETKINSLINEDDLPKKPYSLKQLAEDLLNVTSISENDTDGDSLPDPVEAVLGTDFNNTDSDLDNLNDTYEIFNGLDPLIADTNHDGLIDYYEVTDVISLDIDGDGKENGWDFDNDNDGVSDGIDISPFALSTSHSKLNFNIKTDGKPIYMSFQLRPSNPEHLKLYYQTWDWPWDNESTMQDLDGSKDDLSIVPWLRLTPNVVPDQSAVSSHGIIITSDSMQARLSPTKEYGNIVAFTGNIFYPGSLTTNLNFDLELIWKVMGNTDLIAKVLEASSGKYISIGSNDVAIANTSDVSEAIIQWIDIGYDRVALKIPNGKYLSVANNNTIIATGSDIGEKEIFNITYRNNNMIGLKAYNGYYLSVSSGNVLVANSSTLTEFELIDYGYYPDSINLVTYNDPFMLTGFGLEENFGTNISLFYDSNKNQTIAASMFLSYEFVRNSTTTIADMPAILYDNNITVDNYTLSFQDRYDAFVSMSNEMIPDTLQSLPGNQILPITICYEDSNKFIDMSDISNVSYVFGQSYSIDLTEESNMISKGLKTTFYNTSTFESILIDDLPSEIENWGLEDNATRTLMTMALRWNAGYNIVTKINNTGVEFTPPENLAMTVISSILIGGLAAVAVVAEIVLTFKAYDETRRILGVLGSGLPKMGVFKTLTLVKSEALESMKAIGGISKASKTTKFLQFIRTYHVLDIAAIVIGIGITIAAAVELADSIGGSVGKEIGATYGIVGSIYTIAYGLLLLELGGLVISAVPVGLVLVLIIVILDLIFGISSKIIEFLTGLIFGSPHDYHHAEPSFDVSSPPEPKIHDKDNNGLDIGDRIDIVTQLIGKVTAKGSHYQLRDWSYTVPWIQLEAPAGSNSKISSNLNESLKDYDPWDWPSHTLLLNRTSTGENVGKTREDEYSSSAWIEPGISMINFPVKLIINSEYKLRKIWYHKWLGLFKCWHHEWMVGSTPSEDLTTLYFDVLPSNLNSFLRWKSIKINDFDGDGLNNTEEVNLGVSNKYRYDTDADGLNDKYEVEIGTDPSSGDTDEDGLIDGHEYVYKTNETDKDSDDDGIFDYLEIAGWIISFNYSGTVFTTRVFSDPADNDTDNDGIDDGTEYWNGLNPRSSDTDGNGTKDIAIPQDEIIAILSNSTDVQNDIFNCTCSIIDIAVDSHENIYASIITYDNNYYILKLDSNLTYISNWALPNAPSKIAIDDVNEFIYVISDEKLYRFDFNGVNQSIPNPISGTEYTAGIDIDSSGNIYIAMDDMGQGVPFARIEKYYSNGTFIESWGSKDTGYDNFTSLRDILIDDKYGIIYALDDKRVMKINKSDWNFITTLPNGYQQIMDIELDKDGFIYVLDQFDPILGEGCIRKFDHNGMEDRNYILTNETLDHPWNVVHYPIRVALNSSTNIYILENKSSDYPNPRIMKFKENITLNPPSIDNTKYDWDGDDLGNLKEEIGWNSTFINNNISTTLSVNSEPLLKDTDFDGLSDYYENLTGSNPRIPDTDGDGLSDRYEWDIGTNILSDDTDGDNLSDSNELLIGSNAINDSDTDDDGLLDYLEFIYDSDPTNNDTDYDGADDYQEFLGNSSLLNPDTDGDYMLDGLEYQLSCDPNDSDSDDDYILDGEELIYGTSPTKNDTDLDKLIDGMEVDLWLNPLSNDTDKDGLSDFIELEWGSNPHVNDTDYDGIPDGMENIQTNFTKEIFLAYDTDLDNKTGEFVENLMDTANVTIITVNELLANYTNEKYVVIIGEPAPKNNSNDNNTVGNLIYEILLDTGSELEEMMKNDSNHIAVRHAVWASMQTVVMLSNPRFLDIGKIIKHLRQKNISMTQNSYRIEYESTPILHLNETFYYGITVDEIDTLKKTNSMVSIIFENWSLPIIEVSKYDKSTTPTEINSYNGLIFGEKSTGIYLDFNIDTNSSKINRSLVIIYYKISDLDGNYDGDLLDFSDIRENEISLYYYDEASNTWVKITKDLDWIIDMGINTTDCEIYGDHYAGYIWIETTHLSLFTIAGYQRIPFWDIYGYFSLGAFILIVLGAVVIVKREEKKFMDNITYEIDGKNLIIKFNHEKDYRRSSTGKTIIVANSHGTKRITGTELYFTMIVYKYPEPKETRRRKKHEMQNIRIELDDEIVKITIFMEKDFGLSSSGKTIIVASSRGNIQIEGTKVYMGLNVFKKQKLPSNKESKKIISDVSEIKTKEKEDNKMKSIKPKKSENEPEIDETKKIDKEQKIKTENSNNIMSKPNGDKQVKNYTLEDIPGVGSVKVKLLNKASIKTIDDLLNCNPEIIADKIDGLGVKSIEKWIEKAKELI